MIHYLDTSVLVSALTNEAASPATLAWLSQQDLIKLAVSDWVATEFSAALSVKMRTGTIDAIKRAQSLRRFADFAALSFTNYPVEPVHFRAAALLADRYQLGLRAGDALHLAISSSNGAILVTRDRRLAEAAADLHIPGLLL